MSQDRRDDPIVVLRVGGSNFETYLSTLTRVDGSYFAARFGNTTNDMTPGGVVGQDQWGRKIYFIDRDPELFKYVLEFLRTGKIDNMLPRPFRENKDLWYRLRDEAKFYALDDLASRLDPPMFPCPPNPQSRGALYMLGTDYGRETYRNPHVSGKVYVGGWCDEICDTEDDEKRGERYNAGSELRRSMFVQHRPQCGTLSEEDIDIGLAHPGFTPCHGGDDGWTAIVELRDASLCPTHYSLRHECCRGLKAPWVFEASTDGKEWKALHEHEGGLDHDTWYIIERLFSEDEDSFVGTKNYTAEQFATDALEGEHRFFWKVQSTDSFYRFFRVRTKTTLCWHGTGFEMFGNLQEL